MTNPPPPPASAMGLVEKWRAMARRHRECGPNGAALAEVREHDADELAAALSLSEEEREAIRYMDSERANAGMTRAVFSASTRDYDTIRALIARVTAQESP